MSTVTDMETGLHPRRNVGGATVETYMPEKDPKGLRPASETPSYLMRRPYILNYYRVNYTAWDCIKSLFTLHNETANIWTHIVGFFIWLAMLKSTTQEQTFLKADTYTQFFTVLSYILCMCMPFFSSLYHCFNSTVSCACFFDYKTSTATSSPAEIFLLRMDLLGIACLWFARLLMEGHLVWWCQRDVFYNVLIFSAAIFLFASSILVYKLNLAALGPLFVLVHLPLLWLLFVGDGTVKNTNSLSPTGKGLSLESHGDLTSHVLYSISGTLCAFVAFFIYKKNIPEKWNPGYFDLFGSSHNWWHIFTWLGPTFVLQGLFKFMVYRVEGIGQHCAAN